MEVLKRASAASSISIHPYMHACTHARMHTYIRAHPCIHTYRGREHARTRERARAGCCLLKYPLDRPSVCAPQARAQRLSPLATMRHHIRLPSIQTSLQRRRTRWPSRFQRRVSTRGGISTRSRTEKLYLPSMLVSVYACCTRNLSPVPAQAGCINSDSVCSSYLHREAHSQR